MKKLILLFLMILISSYLVYAEFSTDPTDYIFADFGDEMANGSAYRHTPADDDLLTTQRWNLTTGTTSAKYDDDTQKFGNMSVQFTGALGGNEFYFNALKNVTVSFSLYDNGDTTCNAFLFLAHSGDTEFVQIGLKDTGTGDVNYFYNINRANAFNIQRAVGWHNYTIEFYENLNAISLWVNDTLQANDTVDVGALDFIRLTGNIGGGAEQCDLVVYDNILIWRGTKKDRPLVIPPDSIIPRINSTINNSNPKFNEHINISANVTDETDLGDCVFSTNQTGSTDETQVVSGTDDYCSQNFTISMTRNNVINFTVLIDDGTNFNQSSHIITVANSLPNQAIIINDTNVTYNKNITINITPSVDVDGDTLTYSWYINGSLVAQSSTVTSIITNQSDGLYNVSVDVTDGIGTTIGGSWFFSIDTTLPLLTVTQPINNSVHSDNMTVIIICDDDNLLRLNYTLTKSDVIQDSFENNSPVGNELSIKHNINTSLYPDGTDFRFTLICSDSHTKKSIDNKLITIIETDKKITWKNIYDFNEIIIYPDDTTNIDNFYSIKQIDRYTFNYNLKTLKSITLNLKADNLKYLGMTEQAGFSPHFITSTNWIDFALDIPATYDVKFISKNHYKITINADTKNYNFNSVGDLNIVTSYLDLIFDNSAPNLSASISTSLINERQAVNFQINCTDANIDRLEIYNNVTGSFLIVQNESSPSSPFNYVHTAQEGHFGHRFDCYDIFGKSNVSSILVYTGLDAFSPVEDIQIVSALFPIITILIIMVIIIFIMGILITDFKDAKIGKKISLIIMLVIFTILVLTLLPIIFNILS